MIKSLIPFNKRNPKYERLRYLRGAIILVEGIIGAGKTTLCSRLHDVFKEASIPVKFFEEEINGDLLNLFLSDMKKYAFTFQMTMMANRQKIYLAAQDFSRRENGISIIDRSFYGDLAFATMHMEKGNISDKEWNVYKSVFSSIGLEQPSNIIYLDVTPETALDRIKTRNRGLETSSYTLEYLQELDTSYKISMEECDTHIQYIDWNDSRTLTDDEILVLCEDFNPFS